ncbi:hypothetical protein BJB45_07775 [Halomonas huangheensis]|uniref:Uncharacterized protein n=1 Tax=Halomonas huangheensis TaxID=1178482 RepID=W1N0Z1_9GAMM|nr:hypothetical protein BJB45_07775 [Halomonas huangheensis]
MSRVIPSLNQLIYQQDSCFRENANAVTLLIAPEFITPVA